MIVYISISFVPSALSSAWYHCVHQHSFGIIGVRQPRVATLDFISSSSVSLGVTQIAHVPLGGLSLTQHEAAQRAP